MASSSFRDSMNSLGWSRRDTTAAPATATDSTPILGRLKSLNPFGAGGYVRLPMFENEAPGAPLPARTRREEEEGWFALSRWDRILVFGALNVSALVLFVICLTPLVIVKPTKFATLWSLASVFFLASWAVMMGPMTYVRHLVSKERLPFTALYFGAIGLTLYSALGLHSIIFSLVLSIIQLACLLWYTISYFPMGATGLKFMASFGSSRLVSMIG